MPKVNHDSELQILLDLDGEVFYDKGYWSKFKVRLVEPSDKIPHGVRYSITFHDKNNTRLIGFDNAHGIRPRRKKYGAKRTTWDHKHNRHKTFPYEFDSASQLLEDFWKEVDQFLEEN